MKYFGYSGVGCSEGFDDNDADVICRDRGLFGGFAYKYSTDKSNDHEVRFISNIDCDGSETQFTQCGNQDWGNIGDCSRDSVAAVYCTVAGTN